MVLMWRQGEGIQGAPADFMMRVGSVPPGTDLGSVPDAGFRVEDLWPAVDPDDPLNNEPGLNISGAELADPTSVDPLTTAKAHRAVLDGDFIYAAYVLDPNVKNGADKFKLFLRWSDDGGLNWSAPVLASVGLPESTNIIEPRLIRTPGGVDSGKPEDIRNPKAFVVAWGTEIMPQDALEPIRDAVFVTRTVDRGLSFERIQALEVTRTAPDQTDEQIQLRMTPDGQNVYAVWIRKDGDQSDVIFNSAVGITPTSDLSVAMDVSDTVRDVGDAVEVTVRVENIGPQSATELRLSMDLPPGLLLTTATPSSGTCDLTPAMRCQFDDLAAGTSATLDLSLVAGTRGGWPFGRSRYRGYTACRRLVGTGCAKHIRRGRGDPRNRLRGLQFRPPDRGRDSCDSYDSVTRRRVGVFQVPASGRYVDLRGAGPADRGNVERYRGIACSERRYRLDHCYRGFAGG
jgi:uncharacterized repeat protein (TIGR01451 family)